MMKRLAIILLLVTAVYVFVGKASNTAAYGSEDVTLGEERVVNFPVPQTVQLVEDVLRGEGVLFDRSGEAALVTLWRPADNRVGFFGSLVGHEARYRYEIYVTQVTSKSSRIVANVRTEYVPHSQVASYKASRRLDLFAKVDQLAATLPPSTGAPTSGGVNFVLLPNEDLRGLAKRVTGDAGNWKSIAQANGMKSPTDVQPFQTVWVPDRLLKTQRAGAPAAQPGR